MVRHTLKLVGSIFTCAVLVLSLTLIMPLANAATSQVTLRPVSTGTISGWTGTGTANSSCSGICDYIDEASSDGDTSYISGGAGTALSGTFGIGGSANSGQTATSIVVHVVGAAANSSIFGYAPVNVVLNIGGGSTAAQAVTFNATSYQDLSVTFTGPWPQSDVANASVTLSKTANGLQPAVKVSMVSAVVSYESPAQNQNATRFYANANNVTPGTPLSATNTLAEAIHDTAFRLRAGLTVSDTIWNPTVWGAHGNVYKLQYVARSAASCSAQTTGWGDVGSSGAIQWNDNAGVANNAAIASLGANDPTTSGTKVYQTYRESNGFTNTSAVAVGNTAIWDFALKSVSPTVGTSYCFRIIQNDNTLLSAYSAYPELLNLGDYGVDIVNASGISVGAPQVNFPTSTVATTTCGISSATLGVSSQRIRVNNDQVKNGWNITMAATTGPTTVWTAGAPSYDYNDPSGSPAGCGDGADGDAVGGQLRVNPSVSTVTPESGCSMTGVSKGSDAKFSQGSLDAITLLSANSSSPRFCYWDLTNVALEQRIPKATPAGSYTLDMTITMTAL